MSIFWSQNNKVRNGAFLKGRRRRCRSKCLARRSGICLFTFSYAQSSKTTSASLPFWGLLTFLLKVVRMGINSNRYWWWIKQEQFKDSYSSGVYSSCWNCQTCGTVLRWNGQSPGKWGNFPGCQPCLPEGSWINPMTWFLCKKSCTLYIKWVCLKIVYP